MAAPKIIYTGPATILLAQYPMDYKVVARYKKNAVVTDGGLVEVSTFHNKDIYYLRFEMLTTAIKDAILTLWSTDGAVGTDFDYYHDADGAKTADVLWNPHETEPKIAPMDGSTIWWTWDVELWEVVT